MWQYLPVFISWDDQRGTWVDRSSPNTPIVGWEAILSYYGRQEWELVNVVPKAWQERKFASDWMSTRRSVASEVMEYFVFFRKQN